VSDTAKGFKVTIGILAALFLVGIILPTGMCVMCGAATGAAGVVGVVGAAGTHDTYQDESDAEQVSADVDAAKPPLEEFSVEAKGKK
jgi:hypothetical protein